MYDVGQFRFLIVRPVLTALSLWSQEAEELIMGTAAAESRGGTYLKQLSGPALGCFQMEPSTHDDIWQHYFPHQTILVSKLIDYCRIRECMARDSKGLIKPPADIMIYHLTYSCAMARVLYHRRSPVVPKDLEGQAAFFKKYYNTEAGKATESEYIKSYLSFLGNDQEQIKKPVATSKK